MSGIPMYSPAVILKGSRLLLSEVPRYMGISLIRNTHPPSITIGH